MNALSPVRLAVASAWFCAGGIAAGTPALAESALGSDLAQVMALPVLTMEDFVAKTRVAAAPRRKAQPQPAKPQPVPRAADVRGCLAVKELLGGGASEMSALVERAAAAQSNGGAPRVEQHPPAIATTLPKATKTDTRTVRVEIGALPHAEPVATRLDAAPVVVAVPATTPVVAAAPAASAAPATLETLTLRISGDSAGLRLSPETLTFTRIGQTGAVDFGATPREGLSLFVRDQHVVRFDKQTNELTALKRGATELYVVAGGRMYIVPVAVEDAAKKWDLEIPDALVSLDGVFQQHAQSARHPGIDAASQQAAGPSLQDSVADAARTLAQDDREARRYAADSTAPSYKPVTIQVVDERTQLAAGKVYPAAGVEVRLIGTEFAARTDATGHLTIRDVPASARFLVRIDDPSGATRPVVAELGTRAATEGGVVRLRTLRTFAFDAFASIAGSVQAAGYGSLCATVVDATDERRPAEGVAVQLDVAAEGPFYFNRYGFLDRGQRGTGPDGRVCVFNVAPGPIAMSLWQGEAYQATVPVTAYANRHVEQDVTLGAERPLRARLASMATAHVQLGSDLRAANSYQTIDMIDLIPLGTNDPMMQLAPGYLAASDALLPIGGKLRAYAQAAEFEPAVYAFPASMRDNVVPLLPRGFVEDLAIYAQVAHDPSLGTVLVEYGHGAAQGSETVSMRLVDSDGRDAGDGWYFADSPVTKAMFFNVPAGTYALIVETRDGYWLEADTVIVYNETVSYQRLGGALRYRP